ncbi:MAG: hypothetical protein GF383_09385 [Candidatus Lokiarchaeota archaeon]|nr:hypothetical protein [Candidatus Lokiarchaeota archaeon]MBD3340726.1 hypothetical protein [Candidatus Lokiarchaeota archaeon]
MKKETLLKVSSFLALVFSFLAAIFLLITPWSYWWYSYRAGGWHYYGSGTVGVWTVGVGPFIILTSLLLFICAIISILTLIPGKIRSKTPLLISLILALVALILIVIGAIITAAMMAGEDLYWSFGSGFYGSISGTILTVIFTAIMIVSKE